MPRCAYLATPLLLLVLVAVPRINSASPETDLEQQFAHTVRPFLVTYCTGCHSGATPTASFDLQQFSTFASVVHDYSHWALVMEKLSAKETPPQAHEAAVRRGPPAGDRLDWRAAQK
jgi:hypothetical protein